MRAVDPAVTRILSLQNTKGGRLTMSAFNKFVF